MSKDEKGNSPGTKAFNEQKMKFESVRNALEERNQNLLPVLDALSECVAERPDAEGIRLLGNLLKAMEPPPAMVAMAAAEVFAEGAAPTPTVSTGLPGKPSSWFLVAQEVRRRYDPKAEPMKTSEWARIMGKWLKSEHPSAAPATEKTLKNNLAPLLRELRASAK